jgi:hypothetical protein
VEAAHRLLSAAVDNLPADHPLHWSALIYRLSNAMFAGRIADVQSDARRIAANPLSPPWAAAMGACCAALMDSYAGNPAAADAWLDEYAGILAAAEHADGFVAFTRGELASPADPAAALTWFERSPRDSARISRTT